jgi:hypothetical protein
MPEPTSDNFQLSDATSPPVDPGGDLLDPEPDRFGPKIRRFLDASIGRRRPAPKMFFVMSANQGEPDGHFALR